MENGWHAGMRKIPKPKFDMNMELSPNVLSSDQLAIYESAQRVLKEAVRKLKIALTLPMMLANMRLVKQMLHDTEFHEAISVLEDFLEYHRKRPGPKEEDEETVPLENVPTAPQLRDIKYLRSIEQEAIDLVEYLFKHNYIIDKLPMFEAKLSDYDVLLINLFDAVRKLTVGNLAKTAEYELDSEIITQEMFRYNLHLKTIALPLKRNIRRTMLKRTVQTAVNVHSLKRVSEEAYIKEIASIRFLNNIRDRVRRNMDAEKAESKKAIVRVQEELDAIKLAVAKTVKDNSVRTVDARQELNKMVATFENLIMKREKTMLDKHRETERTKDIHDYEETLTRALNVEYNMMKAKHYKIVEMYFIRKLRAFWLKIMVKKIENWVCSVWKKMAEREQQKRETEEEAEEDAD